MITLHTCTSPPKGAGGWVASIAASMVVYWRFDKNRIFQREIRWPSWFLGERCCTVLSTHGEPLWRGSLMYLVDFGKPGEACSSSLPRTPDTAWQSPGPTQILPRRGTNDLWYAEYRARRLSGLPVWKTGGVPLVIIARRHRFICPA